LDILGFRGVGITNAIFLKMASKNFLRPLMIFLCDLHDGLRETQCRAAFTQLIRILKAATDPIVITVQ
jgi:hypothetical protein